MKHLFIFFLLFSIPAFQIVGQEESKDKKWDVTNPDTPNKKVSINTDEATWINVDVSPDGTQIVFDVLGDIFIMPVEGGEAKPLRTGHAWESQPRFSPNGKMISFTSDANGADNIWIMNTDGKDSRQVTKEDFRLLNNASWTPDGNYLVARKHFTSTRSLGAGEIWMFHKNGGSGIQLTKRKNDQQDVNEPIVSPDGKYLYYSEDVYPGGYFKYNKDPNSQIYVIKRKNLETGDTETYISGGGGAIRPQISPNGEKMAFVRRVRTKTVLFIHDFKTGINTPVYDGLSKDQQEAWAIFGPFTGYDWLPDNKHVIIYAEGKIKKVNTETGEDTIIPFKVSAEHTIVEALKFKHNPAPEKFEVKVIRNATTSPDGKNLAFSALGYIWIQSLPNGKPKKLTPDDYFSFEPSFSPDGKTLAFVSWDDEDRGAIHTIPSKGGNITKLTTEKGIYRTPKFSHDGSTLVFKKEDGNPAMGFGYTVNPGIYTMKVIQGAPMRFITKEGDFPEFGIDDERIFYQTGGYLFGSLDKNYFSVNRNGKDKQKHFHSKYANSFHLSPDNKWIAFSALHEVYVAPFTKTGETIEISKEMQALPVKKVSSDAGINIHWNSNGEELHWTLGDKYYSIPLSKVFTFVEGAPDSIGDIKADSIDIQLTAEFDKPEGLIAFTNARIITMSGDEVIENGVIVVEGNKIIEVGPVNEIEIPSKAKTIDAKGKTIMPGLVDTHAHLNAFRYGLSPQKEWPYYANLAFGVTTTHDPSSNTEMSLSQSELVKSGRMVGPRIFSTGTILYGADGDFKAVINSLEDARQAVRRTAAFGAISVKSYNQPRRDQRQQVIQASRENNIMVYPEGGSTFYHNMTMILDGHTSIEHNIPVAPLYNDVITLWSESNTANTPTLIVNYGGLNGEYYWYQKTNVWENEKLLKYTPRGVIDARSRHRTMAPEEEYKNGHILVAEQLKKLHDKGVKVCVGGHGQLQGLGVHWELWMLVQGGFSNLEALQAATLDGAEYIGMEDHIGSIEKGKLADFIILGKNPLEDIENTQYVEMTMVNGRLYETETMNEIGNTPEERSKFYWEMDGVNSNFDWHSESNAHMLPRCHCQSH
ncbi:amidohydrolase family protein [Mangrovivirga sp. M17]|uniref:Amidohydrolase family protein n=1 Tax=Mangrovivirga halotolerans TaxID=2993936 RepID=A0ABT3RRM9_9BACT|nr:amidohydrolase family protein [Mangrovivirga halotolerans]MCX2744434.1 amidohydrolase family protein [Mangrovivirga halotolerans]